MNKRKGAAKKLFRSRGERRKRSPAGGSQQSIEGRARWRRMHVNSRVQASQNTARSVVNPRHEETFDGL
jgi:hypothetical protein